ncbi:hypothetical protein CR513_11201, partial [Mucuna pruriens]
MKTQSVQIMQISKLSRPKSNYQRNLQNLIPARSNFSTMKNVGSNCNQIRAGSNSANMSRPQQQKAEIMSAHLVSEPNQVGQSDPKLTNDTSSSLPPLVEMKPLSSHLKYAYLDNFNGRGSLTHKATAKKDESDHPRRGQEGSDKTTCHRDHLSHLE